MRRLGNSTDLALSKNLYAVSGNGRHEAEPLGAVGDLRRRLFTRRIEDAPASQRNPRSSLQQERALADSWFAAQQDDGARDSAPTKNSV
jgi:hypothetical protein